MSNTHAWSNEDLRGWNTEQYPQNLSSMLITDYYSYYSATFEHRDRAMEVNHDYIDVSIATGSRLFAPSDSLVDRPLDIEAFLRQYQQELQVSFQKWKVRWKMYLACPVLIFLGEDTEKEHAYRRELARIFVAFHHRDKNEAVYYGEIGAKHL